MTHHQRIDVCIALFVCMITASPPALSQEAIDRRLMAEIARIPAIDNHSHAEPARPGRDRHWNFEQPLGEPRYPEVVPLRRDNPEWLLAWRALYDYRHKDLGIARLQSLLTSKRELLERRGESWPTDVLDAAGIQIALINTTDLGSGQRNDRFRWVPYADPLLWPFAGDRNFLLFTGGHSSNDQLLRAAGLASLPPSLEAYRAQVIEPTLARWAAAGAVAVKFQFAYVRSLEIELVERAPASALYAKVVDGIELTASQRKALEDHLFAETAVIAGAHGLVVQIHTGNGDGPYFENHRANPALLEAAIGSKPLRGTNFVLVHGGWPFTLTTQAMLDKPNTYADFSAQTFYLTTHALADVLRGWLGWHPEKVLFGTDAYSDVDSPLTDYEEKTWLMTHKARRALAIALTAMMRDGEISRARALDIARMVLRDNAVRLYRLADSPPAP